MLINVMFVVLMFGFSIFPRAFVCEYFFCPFELLFALSRKEIKALSFFSIEFTIFQEFSVRLGSEMSFVTKWRLWSRKLYLLFPLKITLVSLAHPFLSLPFFIMEKPLREKNVISFLVAAICIEIFYWFHIAESFLLFFCCCRVVRSRSSVRASPSKLKEWNGMKKKMKKVEWENAIKTEIERCYIWSLVWDPIARACIAIYACSKMNILLKCIV